MINHFYNDYCDSVDCSNEIKQLAKSRTDADAVLTMFLAFYANGHFGTGTKKKALYTYDEMTIAIQPMSNGKLYVSINNVD